MKPPPAIYPDQVLGVAEGVRTRIDGTRGLTQSPENTGEFDIPWAFGEGWMKCNCGRGQQSDAGNFKSHVLHYMFWFF